MKNVENLAYWERTPAYILSVFLEKTLIISNSNEHVIITHFHDFSKTFMI